SGPASSVIGGMKLTDLDDALILDMGGTTSDLAAVRDKMTVLSSRGVDVGSWRTGTRAIKLKTIGLGGDSLIGFDQKEALTIGPKRALPLSYLAKEHPNVKDELERIEYEDKWHSLSLGEFYCLNSIPDKTYVLTDVERSAVEALKKGPLSKQQLAKTLDVSPFLLKLEALEKPNFIMVGGLTPSDLMHISGDYEAWDKEGALLGGRILAKRLNISLDNLIDNVHGRIVKRLYKLVIEFLLSRNTAINATLSPDAIHLIDMAFKNPSDELQVDISSHLPIIGIGAPAHVYINRLAKALNTKGIIPEYAGVANALGAVTGSIATQVTVVIKSRYDRTGIIGYGCHTPGDYFETEDYQEALNWARQAARKTAEKQAHTMGAVNVATQVSVQEQKYEDARIELHMQTDIRARSIGSQPIYSLAKPGGE
ncbi:MAG TPA: hydantoinase/oxoprolinase family protein, partial [Bacillota bacterium]|nr:hydantoinase/oxoprolinase family protein [Bacillota bacterium]